MVEQQSASSNPPEITLTLEIVPEDLYDADPSLIEVVGRDTVDALHGDGFVVRPIYTGQKGGFFVEILNFLIVNKDALDIASALVTISTPIVVLAKSLLEAYERRTGKDIAQQQPIKITAEIGGKLVSIETSHLYLQETEKAAEALARQLEANSPALTAMKITSSTVKVKCSVPKRRPRKRR